jgi:hypothetical protein
MTSEHVMTSEQVTADEQVTGGAQTGAADDRHLIPLDRGWAVWRMAAVRSAGLPFRMLEALAVPGLLAAPPGEERSSAIREAIRQGSAEIARAEAFQEALAWQNPGILDSWLDEFCTGRAAGPKRAYREGIIARYAQRYCAKNESIGFFGPVGWASWDPGGRGLTQQGDASVRRRYAYLEPWAVAALAGAWSREPGILRYLPVRLDPASTFTAGGTLRRPRRPAQRCGPLTSALLTAIDGRRSCGQVLAAVTPAHGAQAARDELERLSASGAIQLGFRVPFDDRPQLHLRRQVEAIPDDAIREELLARLDNIGRALGEAAAARGPAAARSALRRLSAQFSKAGCGAAAVPRRDSYGRTPAYLDCRGDLDVLLGGDLLAALQRPLAVLLDSARWLAAEVAATASEQLGRHYRWLASRRETVTLADLQFAAGELLSGGGRAIAEAAADFQLRWAEILPADQDGEIRMSTADVAPLVDTLFPAPRGPGWAASRQHAPDLMLARGPDGSLRWVLGELHVALNTMESRVFLTQCDRPDELVSATAADMRNGRIVPVYPLDAVEATGRTYPPPALDPPGLYRYWSYGSDQGHPGGAETAPATGITVREEDGHLIGHAAAQGWAAPVAEFFGEFLTAVVVNLFQIRAPRPHLARLLLDDVVIGRESWNVPAAAIPLGGRKPSDRSHTAIRQWAAELGIPRRCFARTPGERKPFYVDFAAPLLVANLVRSARQAAEHGGGAEVELVEMLPGPDELWLTDAAGRRHTAEFRIVAVDEQEVPPVLRPARRTAQLARQERAREQQPC